MTTAGGIIISWTLILFVLAASQNADLQGEKGAVCNVRVSGTQIDPVWNCRKCEDSTYRKQYLCRGKICSRTEKNLTTSWLEQRCCEGYNANKNSICEPQCSPKCEEGHYCAKPNKCDECLPGWAGQNCTESLWCVVKVNLTPRLSGKPSVEVPYNDTSTKWKRAECLPKCRDQASHIYPLVAEAQNMKMYFVPIESPCNIEDDLTLGNLFERYKYPLAGTLGIILCAIVVFCVTCFLKRKRKAACDGEGIPMKTEATQDYMVENMIYS